jgi:hypothetical protein
MGAKIRPKIVIAKGEENKKIEVITSRRKGDKGPGLARSDFEPRLKSPGDLIQAEEWNDIQDEIKDDLMNLVNGIEVIGRKSSTMIASGIASHDVFVEPNWEVQPHVILSPSGTVNEVEGNMNLICYPHDISSSGFRVFAQSRDGRADGIVNWIAFGVS